MNMSVLKILADNARCSVEDIATMTGLSYDVVKSDIKELEGRAYQRIQGGHRLGKA